MESRTFPSQTENAIIGLVHLVLQTDLTDRQRDYLSKVQTAGQHLLGVVTDVLDLSKVEAGRLELEHAPRRPCAAGQAPSAAELGGAALVALALAFNAWGGAPQRTWRRTLPWARA